MGAVHRCVSATKNCIRCYCAEWWAAGVTCRGENLAQLLAAREIGGPGGNGPRRPLAAPYQPDAHARSQSDPSQSHQRAIPRRQPHPEASNRGDAAPVWSAGQPSSAAAAATSTAAAQQQWDPLTRPPLGAAAGGAWQGLQRWAESDFLRRCAASYCRLSPSPRSTIAAAFSPDGRLLASTQ